MCKGNDATHMDIHKSTAVTVLMVITFCIHNIKGISTTIVIQICERICHCKKNPASNATINFYLCTCAIMLTIYIHRMKQK